MPLPCIGVYTLLVGYFCAYTSSLLKKSSVAFSAGCQILASYQSADILEKFCNEDSQIRWVFRVSEILGNHIRLNRQFRVGGLWFNANDRH